MAHYSKFGLENDEPKDYEIRHPQQRRGQSQSSSNIRFLQACQPDEVKREAEVRRSLLDQIERLCIQQANRESIRALCGRVTPASWPFEGRKKQWSDQDMPAVALVIASFHDRYSGAPAILVPECQGLCEKVALRQFYVDELRPMVLHLERYIQNAAVPVESGAASDPAGGKQSEPTRTEGPKEPDPEALLTPKKLAELHNLPYERVRAMLRRLQKSDHNCFREVETVSRRDPQFLYRYGSVLPAIQKMKDKAKTASERPAKKKPR